MPALLGILLLFVSVSAYTGSPKTPMVLDTDMAIDDWAALLLLAMHPEVELLAVTANGAGETRCPPAMRNIPALLDLTPAREVVIACGDDYPLDGFFAFPEPWRKQADSLSDVALPASNRPVSQQHAVDILHKTFASQSDKAVLVTTGSLTNVAQWLEKYPDDRKRIARVVIMGGAFDVPGNIVVPGFTDGHPNKNAEWNIFVDAKAAVQVFASGLPIEVVGLDVTNQVRVTEEFAKAFKASVKTPAAEFWDKVLDDNDWFIASGEYYFWDVLAAIVAIDPSYCEGGMASVEVGYKKSSIPWQASSLTSIPDTTVQGKERHHLDAATAGTTRVGGNNPKVKICRKTKAKEAFALFIATLNRQ